MAPVMGSEILQLLKEQQEAWGNLLTTMLTKLEAIERGSPQTDAAAHSVENHGDIVNLEIESQTQADLIPICDAQPARAASVIESSVVSYPESVQLSIQHPRQQMTLSKPSSLSCQYVSKSKRKEEISAIQYSKRTTVTQKKDWRMTGGYFSILHQDHTTGYSHANRQYSLSQRLTFSMRTTELYTVFIPRTFACLHSTKNMVLKLTIPRLLLSIYLRMHCKLKMRQTHRIHQPYEDGLESGVASDSTDVIFFIF